MLVVVVMPVCMGMVFVMLVLVIMSATSPMTVIMLIGMRMFMRMSVIVAMIVGMGVIMPVTVIVQMGVGVIVIMRMIMPAAAIGTVHMCAMIVSRMIMGPVIMTCMVIGTGFGLERPCHMMGVTALPAHHFSQHMIILNIDRIGGEFGRRVAVADMPGHFQQSQRIFSLDFQQCFGSGFDEDQRIILELQAVAVIQHAGLVEIEQKTCALVTFQHNAAFVTSLVIECNLIDHLFVFHGRFADNSGGAQHGISLSNGLDLKAIIEPKIHKSKATVPCMEQAGMINLPHGKQMHEQTCKIIPFIRLSRHGRDYDLRSLIFQRDIKATRAPVNHTGEQLSTASMQGCGFSNRDYHYV